VLETSLDYSDFQTADEIFSSGNFSKLSPITRIDDRHLAPGPFYRQARALYWNFAHTAGPPARAEIKSESADCAAT
jgi:branched-chain amino acid aminotransferase